MLDRQTDQTAGQLLQAGDGLAVVKAGRQIVGGGGRTQVLPEGDIEAEPLAVATLVIQHTDMGPEPQVADMNRIQTGHSARSVWVKRRFPVA